jgi:hypothetical protein
MIQVQAIWKILSDSGKYIGRRDMVMFGRKEAKDSRYLQWEGGKGLQVW